MKALAKLIIAPTDIDDAMAFKKEMKQLRNDRGFAILVAANLENVVEEIIARLVVPDKREELFDGPLHTFSAKLLMAYSLGVYGRETYRNLDHIRQIRNVFAHSKKPITFKTPEVKAACDLLSIQEAVFPKTVQSAKLRPHGYSGRKRFNHVSQVLSHNLVWHSLRLIDHKGIARGALRPEIEKNLDPRYQLRLMPDPLP